MSIAARQRILIAISLAAFIVALLAPPIPQDPGYHLFADANSLLAIPNAFNIFSNLLFLWVGVEGLYRLRRGDLAIIVEIRAAYLTFFAALILIALGSGYYHWSPDNWSLAWDRLAMTFAFMSLFAILLAERVSPGVARRLFPWLILAGVGSIVYWYWSEQAGHGDLRPYALVQFLPMLLIPIMLALFPSRYSRGADLWWLLGWYLIAKLLEFLDHEVYQWLAPLSGHSAKHICAGIACLVLLRHLRLRHSLAS